MVSGALGVDVSYYQPVGDGGPKGLGQFLCICTYARIACSNRANRLADAFPRPMLGLGADRLEISGRVICSTRLPALAWCVSNGGSQDRFSRLGCRIIQLVFEWGEFVYGARH